MSLREQSLLIECDRCHKVVDTTIHDKNVANSAMLNAGWATLLFKVADGAAEWMMCPPCAAAFRVWLAQQEDPEA